MRFFTSLLNSVIKESKMSSYLPLFLEGEVVKGFGRGSRDLGCPTANYPLKVIQSLPKELAPGVYYGWAQVDFSPVYKMVANIGWCPFYQNKEKSVEIHVMHKFDKDFYGSNLKVSIIGYLREEKNFKSVEELVQAIKEDIDNAHRFLENPNLQNIKDHSFFKP